MSRGVRPYVLDMMNSQTTWRFQTSDQTAIHQGCPTDSRGLRLRAQSGYSHVHMSDASGWLQLSVAIRKLESKERMAVFFGDVLSLSK